MLQAVLVLSALVAATGRLPRLAGWVCFLAVLDWQTNNFAYGKIDHDSFALVVALAVLPTAGRASWRRWRMQDGDERVGWALRAVQLAVVASYFLAALAKFRFGGLLWANGATFSWAFSRRGSDLALELAAVPGLLVVGQWTVLLAELTSPVMLWLRGRLIWFAVAFWGSFRLLTYLAIGIHFMALAVCLVAFVPAERAGSLVLAARRRLSGVGPGLGDPATGVTQQLRQGLRTADDRQEVRVAAPARDDVLVQVRRDPGPGDGALVHPEVEAVRRRDL